MLGRLKIFNLRHASSRSILFSRPILSKKKATSFCFSTFSSSSRRKGARWGKDEILAMATWLLVGTGAFVLVGTTTAASFGLLLANSLQFQGILLCVLNSCFFFCLEFVVGKVAKWLESSLGWKVSFGSGGIVPNWRDGRITLRDVSVCLGDVNRSDLEVPPYEEDVCEGENYTRFSVQFDRLDIRISLRRWLEGRGLLEKVFVDGARGVLDKRWIRFIDGWKWKSRPGDFDLNSLELRNVHLSIVQPVGFRSYAVTILSASVPRLRAGWLFYDLLSSDSAHGIFDGRSLFTLHKTQGEEERELRHFRMLGLDVRHLNQGGGGGVGGGNDNSLGWVTRGTVDIEGFYQLPGKRGSRSFEDSNNLADSFNFTPDTLKEKLLLPLLTSSRKKQQGSDCDDCGYFQEYSADLLPLKYLYDSRIRPRIPEKFQEISDKLVSIPSNICDRLIESKWKWEMNFINLLFVCLIVCFSRIN